MGVLRKKEERTETVTVRVPSRVKADLDRLREETSAANRAVSLKNSSITRNVAVR